MRAIVRTRAESLFFDCEILKKDRAFRKNLNFVKVPRTGETTLLFAWQLIGCRTARDRFR